MKFLKPFALIIALFFFFSCDKDVIKNPSSIEIGNYIFNFDTQFTLEELEGFDSYVGKINGSGISLSFDYGWYTGPATNLPANEYTVTEDEINGHYRQIVKPVDSELNHTRIHLYKISDAMNSPGSYNSLTVRSKDLTVAEQEMIIEVFNNVVIVQ